jgi:hypothetical protein
MQIEGLKEGESGYGDFRTNKKLKAARILMNWLSLSLG